MASPAPVPAQHIHRLNLSFGTLGSSSLEPQVNKRNEVVGLEFVPGVSQNEDLRIRSSQAAKATLVYPSTISCQNDSEMLELEGDRLDFVKDSDHFNIAAKLLPSTPINPTVLLRSVVDGRPATTRQQTSFIPPNLNHGNTLAILTPPPTTTNNHASTSQAYWRQGDSDGRATLVGCAAINRPPQPLSRADKGKQRASNQDEGDDPMAGEDGSAQITFRSRPGPLFAHPTTSPILQIQAAPLATRAGASTLLAVRTHTSIALSYLQPTATDNPVVASYAYTGRQLGRRPIADLALGGVGGGGRGGEGMVVDVDGELYGWGLGQAGAGTGLPEMFRLRKGIKERGYSGMVRLAFGGSRGNDAVVGFEDQVLLYDLRSPRASSTLVTPALLAHDLSPGRDRSPSQLTSLCTPSPTTHISSPLAPTSTPSPIQVISTTRDVLWLDERMPGKDVLRWRHGRLGKEGRGPDRSLGLVEVPRLEGEHGARRVALHSRVHAGVSVFTYLPGGVGPPRSLLDPYLLPGPVRAFTRSGIAFSALDEGGWLLTETGVDGAVYSRPVSIRDDELGVEAAAVGRVWDQAVTELAAAEEARVGAPAETAATVGNKQAREFKLIDLSRSCEMAFKSKPATRRKKEEAEEGAVGAAGEEVIDALDRAKEQLKRAVEADEDLTGEAGAAGILTGFDLLALGNAANRRAKADDPADATAPPQLPRPSTFRGHDKLSILHAPLPAAETALDTAARQIRQLAPWSATILPAHVAPPAFHRDELLTSSPDTMALRARHMRQRYGLGADPSDGTKAERLAGAACEQLVLDATLSSLLFSPRTILPTDPPALARANAPFPAELDPPQLQFSYFRPQARARAAASGLTQEGLADGEEEEEDEHDWRRANLKSVGVRMLLSEWHVGSDPHEYAWTNPYANEPEPAQPQTRDKAQSAKAKRALAKKDSGASFAASQAPPAFVSSQAPPTFQLSQAPPAFQSSQAPRSLGTVREGVPSAFSASQPVGVGGGGGGGGEESQAEVGAGAFTQVVPGAWGGRQGKEKKKGKKRVSGF